MPKQFENDYLGESHLEIPQGEPLQITKKKAKKTAKKASSEKKKTGTPSLYKEKIFPFLSDIKRYIRCGVTEGQLATYYNVGKTSWAKYKKDNPEFDETINKAKTEFKTDIVNRAYEVAMGYEYTETTTVAITDNDGNTVGEKTTTYKKYAKADAGMLQFLLINKISDEFARDPHILELRRKALELAEQGKASPNMEEI